MLTVCSVFLTVEDGIGDHFCCIAWWTLEKTNKTTTKKQVTVSLAGIRQQTIFVWTADYFYMVYHTDINCKNSSVRSSNTVIKKRISR